MAAKKKSLPKPKDEKVSWAQAVRDVVIASMNHGQLPILGFICLLALIVWRMPSADVALFVREILNRMAGGELLSYPILLIVTIGWYMHSRIIRKNFNEEYERMGKEKTSLQRQLTGIDLKTSDNT
jgi:ABC-type multidrug transport system fused ATPase/permease subunit